MRKSTGPCVYSSVVDSSDSLENKGMSAKLQKNRQLAKSTGAIKIYERDIKRESTDTVAFCSGSVYFHSKGKRD